MADPEGRQAVRYIHIAVISFTIGIVLSMLTATAFASPVVDEEVAMECVMA